MILNKELYFNNFKGLDIIILPTNLRNEIVKRTLKLGVSKVSYCSALKSKLGNTGQTQNAMIDGGLNDAKYLRHNEHIVISL